MGINEKIKTDIELEMKTAFKKYGYSSSTHAVYAVLLEEVDEFWDLVKMKTTTINKEGKRNRMIHELTQISAIAIRTINELKEDKIRWV